MNDEIRAMAREAGFYDGREELFWVGPEGLERFADLVLAGGFARDGLGHHRSGAPGARLRLVVCPK